MNDYSIKESLVAPLKQETASVYQELCKESVEQAAAPQAQLVEVQEKLDNIEEKYFVTGK